MESGPRNAAPMTPLPAQVKDIVAPDVHQISFAVENFLKNELKIKLDKDEQICQANLSPMGCPLGPLNCPLRHTMPMALNFQPPPQVPTHGRERERLQTVCKHWLRGLCKKGDACEFLHEYNLRRMPECWWFSKYGYCPQGDECLYSHPKERKVECPDYNRGFCKLGPECPRKHVRRIACQLYLNGFCPLGPTCPRGHPKFDHPIEADYRLPSPPPQQVLPPTYGRFAEFAPMGQGGGGGGGSGFPGGGGAGGPGGGGGASREGGFQRKNFDDVLCFKCGQYGHYANTCRNRAVPGDRGGLSRRQQNLD